MSQTPFVNFVTFQVWALFTTIGLVLSVATWSMTPVSIAPIIGLVVGIATNEVLPGHTSEGVKIKSQ